MWVSNVIPSKCIVLEKDTQDIIYSFLNTLNRGWYPTSEIFFSACAYSKYLEKVKYADFMASDGFIVNLGLVRNNHRDGNGFVNFWQFIILNRTNKKLVCGYAYYHLYLWNLQWVTFPVIGERKYTPWVPI